MKELFQYKNLSKLDLDIIWNNLQTQTHSVAQKTLLLAYFHWNAPTWDIWELLFKQLQQNLQTVQLPDHRGFDWISVPAANREQNTTAHSLAVALVVAGAGIPVVKWGDFGYGNQVGYSDILQHLGGHFGNKDWDSCQTQLKELNFTYLHAPDWCPMLQLFAEARLELQAPSFLDTLLPLLHPALGISTIVGASTTEQMRFFQHWKQFQQTNTAILYDLSQSPLITLTGDFQWSTQQHTDTFRLSDWSLPQLSENVLASKKRSVAQEAKFLTQLLAGQASDTEKTIVIANAALALQWLKPELSYTGALAEAEASLLSGRGAVLLDKLV